jgi:hypothetical protein
MLRDTGSTSRESGSPALLPPFGGCRFHEVELVSAGWVERGEVGGD